MDHLIGQRFNLISKSEIRYVGTLHEINPEQSTIALENVYSFGTEDRNAEKFVPPSQQKYGFIVFRGSDVKDIKIAEEEQSQPSPPPSMPNDPAILNASRPGPSIDGPPRDSPFSPPGYPPHPGFGGFYPPPGQFGRGYGPPPPGGFGPGPGFPPYGPPPPGYFGPPGGQGFPPPPGPGPHPFQHGQAPIGPPGQRSNMPQPQPPPPPPTQQQQPPEPKGRAPAPSSTLTSELPDNKAGRSAPSAPPKTAQPSIPPQANTARTENVPKPPASTATAPPPTQAPPGPKTNRVTPAIPFQVNQKSFTPPVQPTADTSANGNAAAKPSKPMPSQAAMDEAARQAKEAVAAAMAKLNPQTAGSQTKSAPSAAAVDALSKRVAEMSTSSTANGTARGGRGGLRGGRGSTYPRGGGGPKKMEIPKSDFDFESANAKFKKEDLVKEAIASGSPPVAGKEENGLAEIADDSATDAAPERKDSLTGAGAAYNKSTSFFDNISSEARDREQGSDGRFHGRQVRSEEFKKNIETFGQGNVDSGFRGRGRGGGYGRGRPYGGNYRGGYNRGHGNGGYRGGRGRGGQGQTENHASSTQAATQS
ncbi:hypothetical protein A1O1_01929 [Capronia coronata CBS 617.96]|uniref:DFDF domain-containing protein n=1 Tax=Capronia coronata CBS 617.96 TaxID=1182541 RepID=W9YKU9_9EURO|nr:uncharacterized protein A1O1_01929 [Capronia coronata CBS 617.96]EXJ93537.1 hypothetical protein A1O1_01929 [Capronia coronata CBS 617.96]